MPFSRAVLALVVGVAAEAANPFLPAWEYIPDGEPRVFGDRVYLYGSHDRAGSDTFCDFQYRVWSAPLDDLSNWTDHGVSFSTIDVEGHADDVPWSDNRLYAPYLVEKDGRFYLYADVVGAPAAVAVSDRPEGPFELVSKIVAPPDAPEEFGGWGSYADPGVLVDDDGRVYLYWGYLQSHMAELDPDTMYEVLPGTYQADIIPSGPPFKFFEAASPRKIDGTYYLIYADGGILTYATSDRPTGPFAYGGPLNRNGRDYPGGNNHGSLAQINGQWYLFYHRMTHGTVFSRKACAERVTIEADGSIAEVEMTSLGFADALDPYTETPAHLACVLMGGTIVEIDRETHPVVGNGTGSTVGFKYFEFGENSAPLTFHARLRTGPAAGAMEIWLDDLEAAAGTRIGTLRLDHADAEPGEWRTLSTTVAPVSGRHAVYFKFLAADQDAPIGDLLGFSFAR